MPALHLEPVLALRQNISGFTNTPAVSLRVDIGFKPYMAGAASSHFRLHEHSPFFWNGRVL